MKIRILTQNPFSVWFWWVEQQAVKYIENIKKIDKDIDISFFSWTEKDFDILHVIWVHGAFNPYWFDVLKMRWIRIVVSSVFYIKANSLFDFRRPILYKFFSFIPFHSINWMKQLLHKADIILPNSEEESFQLQSIFWINSQKIHSLANGVDEKYFAQISKDLFKKKYNLWDYFLCVSHIEPRKNHIYLIKAFLKYKRETQSNTKLILLWDFRGNYFLYHEKIKQIISQDPENIIHIANLSNSQEIFKSAYLWAKWYFLLSSLETPWLSNLESALAGCSLILGDCKPVREYFWSFAKYVFPKDIESIVSCMKNLDQSSSQQLAQVQHIQSHYSWEKIWNDLLKYYRKIWNKK